MRISKALVYKNKATGEVRSFVWYESTHLGTPPMVLQLQLIEIPAMAADPETNKPAQEERVRVELPADGIDQHKVFSDTDLKDENWQLLQNKPTIPEIPLPEISELNIPRASRNLLDTAQRYFADAKRYPDI